MPRGSLRQETVLVQLGKKLHVELDDLTQQPLPRRWIELIQHLNAQERMRAGMDRGDPQSASVPTRPFRA